ncbi:hypothetical protein FRC05_000753 [Tulasnella sp. 425]|nr:hypothetical protein FRC05_000753 [Tulasnella sp. 425]
MAGGKRTTRKSSTAPKGSVEVKHSSTPASDLCGKPDLGRAALACRKWSPVALDHLWEELDSIVPLLALVQPLRLVLGDNEEKRWVSVFIGLLELVFLKSGILQEFEGNVADADWGRFRQYAYRIRIVVFDENDTILGKKKSFIAFSSIQALAFVHPFGPSLLPNLQRIFWCCTRDDTALCILPFLSPSLHTLELDIDSAVSSQSFQRLLRSLVHRTPCLKHFQLSTKLVVAEISDILAQLLSTTPTLQTATLPQFFHTPEILVSLGRLEQLEELKADWRYANTDYFERGTTLLFPNGSYPALRTLHFHSSLALATMLFKTTGPISQLKEVCFSTRKCYPFKLLKEFLSAVTRGCPQLEVLHLNFASIIDDPGAGGSLALDNLRPCLSLVHLRELQVAYDCSFILRDDDVWEMARAWKNLRVLRLCSDPGDFMEYVGTPIAILKTFSRAIPDLEYLSLYFHENEVPQFEPDLKFEDGFNGPFELDVGFSLVPGGQEHSIGFFLGTLCRQKPTISVTQTDWTACSDYQWPQKGEQEDKKWGRVEALARMICQAKMSINTRIQSLLSRVESLERMIVPTAAA